MIHINDPYWLFMAEAAGMDRLVTTHQARLNAIVRDIRNHPSTSIDAAAVRKIATMHSIPSLTASDWKYIQMHLK